MGIPKHLLKQINRCPHLRVRKDCDDDKNGYCTHTGEYATSDRLHNFKVAAELQNCTPMTALAGMMAKHTVSVYDLIQRQENGADVSPEMWDEKIGDHINYLILLSAMVRENFSIFSRDSSFFEKLGMTADEDNPSVKP